ncbi:hypothetical protein SEVIR_5G475100v4 [Setaria viridis]|uniref:Kinetochore protein SPC25 n=1 Tax=Setaria viridis TaxID=4556 RepID=A0A4U6URC4_SETVI|nr:kinetochore protein SPC25 homolog isoform X1 [Setaria viridis]TKW19091.1 hypothetical protein SEVIR_5G475100v2 [Setaria viridis]
MAAEPAVDLLRRMQDRRAAIQRRISHAQERATATAAAFSAALLSARSIANQTVSNRAQLNDLKQQLRKLEADLAQALSVQTSKRSKHKLMSESILNTTATNEQLRSLVMDQRARRDEYVNAISNQLQAIESLEAENDTKGDKNLEKAIMWYDKFLGFQVVGGEGVKFVFSKIDVQSPDREYSFCIKLIEERYILVHCVPFVDGSKELVKHLNCNNDLYKFVRTMRERFQVATISGNLSAISFCPDMSSITSSSLSALSLDSRSENSTNQRHTRSRSKNLKIPTKKGLSSQSAASPGSMVRNMRRSPRIVERC